MTSFASLTLTAEACELLKRSLVLAEPGGDEDVAASRAIDEFPYCPFPNRHIQNNEVNDESDSEQALDKCVNTLADEIILDSLPINRRVEVSSLGTCVRLALPQNADSTQSSEKKVVIDAVSSRYDPVVELYDNATGELLDMDDDSGNGLDARLIHTVRNDIAYTVHIAKYQEELGTVEFRLSEFPQHLTRVPNSMQELQKNDCGESIDGLEDLTIGRPIESLPFLSYNVCLQKSVSVCRYKLHISGRKHQF